MKSQLFRIDGAAGDALRLKLLSVCPEQKLQPAALAEPDGMIKNQTQQKIVTIIFKLIEILNR